MHHVLGRHHKEDITPSDVHIPLTEIECTITRACARQLNLEATLFLSMFSYVMLENVCYLMIYL
jgi:hypothetical protein